MVIDVDAVTEFLKSTCREGDYAITSITMSITMSPHGEVNVHFGFDYNGQFDKIAFQRPDISDIVQACRQYRLLSKPE